VTTRLANSSRIAGHRVVDEGLYAGRLTTCRKVPTLKRIRGASTNRGMAWECRPF
jgi:hypothetical protein